MGYLDNTGLAYFWSKIKAYIAAHPGPKGDTGDSGVYYGTTAPTDPDVDVWINPEGAIAGGFVPAGGAAGKVLMKNSATDNDTIWGDIPIEVDTDHPPNTATVFECMEWAKAHKDAIHIWSAWSQVTYTPDVENHWTYVLFCKATYSNAEYYSVFLAFNVNMTDIYMAGGNGYGGARLGQWIKIFPVINVVSTPPTSASPDGVYLVYEEPDE